MKGFHGGSYSEEAGGWCDGFLPTASPATCKDSQGQSSWNGGQWRLWRLWRVSAGVGMCMHLAAFEQSYRDWLKHTHTWQELLVLDRSYCRICLDSRCGLGHESNTGL